MATILVVDDQPVNRELIDAYLENSGHTIVHAESGEAALAAADTWPIDLVLLDVMMPEMDGYEVIRRLRISHAAEVLPIVLVTALHDRQSRLRGLSAGADEFLTKPVDGKELEVRVGNLLKLRARGQELVRQNAELRELHRFRDELSHLLVHDMKNPMTAVQATLRMLQKSGTLPEREQQLLVSAIRSGERVVRLLGNLLDVARAEAHRLELHRGPVDCAALINRLAQEWTARARYNDISLSVDVPATLDMNADVDLLTRVVENLLENAIRYATAGGSIHIGARQGAAVVRLEIGNTGYPVPVEQRRAIFEKFAQNQPESGRMNLGLGLYFCRLAVQAHGGRIWVEETAAYPTVFVVELPAAP